MREYFRKHLLLSSMDKKLPLNLESVGYLPRQGPIRRDKGYPEYHWIQTVEGEGEFEFGGDRFLLGYGQGVLLLPSVPHRYRSASKEWATIFLTFGGSLAQLILTAMELHYSSLYRLEQPDVLIDALDHIIEKVKVSPQFSGMEGSLDVYNFLLLLKKYGVANSNTSVAATLNRLNGLLQWLEQEYGDPGISLADMAEHLHITPQRLNSLFRNTLGNSPYSYLIQLRIQKAKEKLAADPQITVKEVADSVGFNDSSHFILTFHKRGRNDSG